MKVLITDHFGILCLADKHGIEHKKTDILDMKQVRIHGDFDNFDKKAVNVLNSIIKLTDCEIVISSDWKRFCSLEKMKDFYKSQGIIKSPLDYTPYIKGPYRGLEIKQWLDTHKVDKWVAIDDLYLELDNFVWVSRTDEGIKQR